HEALVAAVFNCCVFGDERDQVLAKWNLIQAQWGTGQAYYSRNAPPLELNEQNPLCRFKAVGYSRLGGREDKDGHVAMLFNKPEQEIKNNQQALTTSLQGLMGNKPNLAVTIECVKAVSENKTQVVIYVVDKGAGNTHISASELSNFLNAGAARNALNGAGCTTVSPEWTCDSGSKLKLIILTPKTTFLCLSLDFLSGCQEQQARLQAQWLQRAAADLAELRTRRAASAARLAQLAATLHARRHTLLQVVARREVMGRVGAALSPEEEAARARLHELTSQLAAPPLYNDWGAGGGAILLVIKDMLINTENKREVAAFCQTILSQKEAAERDRERADPGRLNELLCAVRLQRSASAGASHERYHLDPGAQEDVKQFLSLQQKGMAHLLDTARKDLAALGTIAEGMSRLVRA
ncbi:hypothetical protein HW555_006007, partial [Spodoptera exigua]